MSSKDVLETKALPCVIVRKGEYAHHIVEYANLRRFVDNQVRDRHELENVPSVNHRVRECSKCTKYDVHSLEEHFKRMSCHRDLVYPYERVLHTVIVQVLVPTRRGSATSRIPTAKTDHS